MDIEITTPNRIDLAGGTTDLHPLYLFLEGGCTVNLAISVNSFVNLRTQADRSVSIFSKDLGESQRARDPISLDTQGPLGLIARTVKVLPPETGLDITTFNEAPAGSGLGASSALTTALLGGLLKLRGWGKSPDDIIRLATDIETAAIGVPTGSQDHIAAYYGGISLIDFGYHGFVRRDCTLEPQWKDRLEEMIILSYTGEGRFSGMNNWEIIKSFIDDRDSIREKLLQIRGIALEMCDVVMDAQWNELPALVNREWTLRRSLAAGVTNARIDSIMASAVKAGAMANKICGAGGGGCMITLVEKKKRSAVEQAILDKGGLVIPFNINTTGMTITQSGS